MDGQSEVQLGHSHCCDRLHRRGIQYHIPAMHQFPCRHVRVVRRVGRICEYVPAEYFRERAAVGGAADVRPLGCGAFM